MFNTPAPALDSGCSVEYKVLREEIAPDYYHSCGMVLVTKPVVEASEVEDWWLRDPKANGERPAVDT